MCGMVLLRYLLLEGIHPAHPPRLPPSVALCRRVCSGRTLASRSAPRASGPVTCDRRIEPLASSLDGGDKTSQRSAQQRHAGPTATSESATASSPTPARALTPTRQVGWAHHTGGPRLSGRPFGARGRSAVVPKPRCSADDTTACALCNAVIFCSMHRAA